MKEVNVHDKRFIEYLNAEHIQIRIEEIAKEINAHYQDRDLLFIGVLNGAFMFASDLLQNIEIPCEITFVKMASYQGTQTTGNVEQLLGLRESIQGRDVVIIEDIVDTGLTMSRALADLSKQNPASLAVATLLFKRECLKEEVPLKYVGFEIPDKFVVGYGLDYNAQGRNLRDIYQLKDD